jgi:nucleoid-associated protein EbfC
MFGGLSDLVQKAQKMRSEMARIQDTLASKQVEASSSNGQVKVVASGKQQLLSITLAPEALVLENKAALEETLKTTVNQALQASQALVSEEMSRVASDLGPLGAMLKGLS